jgi:hypothetical protein
MNKRVKILLQTTVPYTEDDWHIGRFSLLTEHLRSLVDANGNLLYEVSTRNREPDANGVDAVLSTLDESDLDQLWLFALDLGDGLTPLDCASITRFRNRGGGVFTARDHYDMGSSLCTLGGIGTAHYFHSKNPDPDPSRNVRDDPYTTYIDFPNYHSGPNGDYQKIRAVAGHELLRRPDGSTIEYFPAHPHEGAVGAHVDSASVVATGMSKATGRDFNLVVAFEHSTDSHGNRLGRAIAESSFHHFVDYNWNTDMGCPSFVDEPPGVGYKQNPQALDGIKQYVSNAATWLSLSAKTDEQEFTAGHSA